MGCGINDLARRMKQRRLRHVAQSNNANGRTGAKLLDALVSDVSIHGLLAGIEPAKH